MLRRSKRILYSQGVFPEASSVYLNSDIIFQILFFLDWPTLFRLSHASRDSKQLVKDETRLRIRQALRIFLTSDIYDSFMGMLRLTGGALVGAVPHWFLTTGIPFKPIPYHNIAPSALGSRRRSNSRFAELQVLVPSRAWDVALRWMSVQGYTSRMPLPPFAAWRNSVSESIMFERPASRKGEYIVTIPCYIRLYRVATDIITTALSSPFSCRTNLVTGSTVISFFPKATADRKCLRSGAPLHDLDWGGAHFHTCIHPHKERRACGSKCPANPLYTRRSCRTKFFSFHDDIDQDIITAATKTRKARKFRPYCYNSRCPRYSQD